MAAMPLIFLPAFVIFSFHKRGAALTILVVYTPAASAGTSLVTRAMSFLTFFMPICLPAALKPFGAVIPPSVTLNKAHASFMNTCIFMQIFMQGK